MKVDKKAELVQKIVDLIMNHQDSTVTDLGTLVKYEDDLAEYLIDQLNLIGLMNKVENMERNRNYWVDRYRNE